MADDDKISVTFTRQKVYHDGTNMQVKKRGDTGELTRAQIVSFLAEKAIEAPDGWSDDAPAADAALVADGGMAQAHTSQIGGSSFDHDGDGEPGGSAPHDPPALAGKNKAALIAIAEAEGVEVSDGMTNDAITKAIEAARVAGAEEAPPA